MIHPRGTRARNEPSPARDERTHPAYPPEFPLTPTLCAARQGAVDTWQEAGTPQAVVRGRFTAFGQWHGIVPSEAVSTAGDDSAPSGPPSCSLIMLLGKAQNLGGPRAEPLVRTLAPRPGAMAERNVIPAQECHPCEGRGGETKSAETGHSPALSFPRRREPRFFSCRLPPTDCRLLTADYRLCTVDKRGRTPIPHWELRTDHRQLAFSPTTAFQCGLPARQSCDRLDNRLLTDGPGIAALS